MLNIDSILDSMVKSGEERLVVFDVSDSAHGILDDFGKISPDEADAILGSADMQFRLAVQHDVACTTDTRVH